MTEPWWEDDRVTVFHGDCIEVMRGLPDNSVDAVVTDPPYGLEFMGKEWDSFRTDETRSKRNRGDRAGAQGGAHKESRGAFGRVAYGGGKHPTTSRCLICGKRDQFRNPHACGEMTEWQTEVINPNTSPPGSMAFQNWSHLWTLELYRVLRPGGHLLAFGGTRTWHRLACAVEDAGFEIRDSIAWMYGSGFPKSLDVSKAIDKKHDDRPATPAAEQWQGWGTALKPAHEPIVVARKPLEGTVAENVLRWGTGALNIDGSRIGTEGGNARDAALASAEPDYDGIYGSTRLHGDKPSQPVPGLGRWPANVILDESQAAELDRQSGDTGGASRFFYVPKADTHERPRDGDTAHPTVKPVDLMRYLVRLVTPPGGTVLDPFAGSGTTAQACIIEGFTVITIEKDETYLPLIRQRLTQPQALALPM